MRPASLLAIVLSLLAGCGGNVATVEPGTSTDAGGSTDAATDARSSDAASIKDSGVLADASTGEYSAVLQAGGLDHLFIQKKDVARNFCFKVHLVHPSAAVDPGFSVPAPWGSAQATMIPDARACDGPSPVSVEYPVKAIVGSVTFGQPTSDQQPYPKTVTINATLTFSKGPPSLGAQEVLSAADIPVTGI